MINNKLMKENNITIDKIIDDTSEENKNKLRKMESEDTYYGMKKITNANDLYNYNMLGLKMQKQILNELDPKTGKSSTYYIMTFGEVNKKIKIFEQQSNLHIILEKKNQMTFNFMKLLYNSNNELKNRSKNASELIISLQNNLLNLLNEYDYSNIFNSCLLKVNSKLNNFTSELFDELINLINNIYDDFSQIIKDDKKTKYNEFLEIRKTIKNENINYIYSIINNLEIFSNAILLFLEQIWNEVNYMTKFEKIDFLYGILDNIYESKLLLKHFNENLYKAIEKGILSFGSDIQLFLEPIIGDLLYIADFLFLNINRNEIIRRAYNEKTLNDLSFKLKNIKTFLQNILSNENINKDYYEEMDINNKNSIISFYNMKTANFLNEIENNSYKVISNIKEKIKYNELYESYTNNLDFLDYIHNKTIIEFIENMNNILQKALNILPEYISKKDDDGIYFKKTKLFEISKLIINSIKKNNNEINQHVFDYTKKYKNENLLKAWNIIYIK